jgi:hypothetical protein
MIIDQETMQAKAWTNSKMHWIPSILAFYEWFFFVDALYFYLRDLLCFYRLKFVQWKLHTRCHHSGLNLIVSECIEYVGPKM